MVGMIRQASLRSPVVQFRTAGLKTIVHVREEQRRDGLGPFELAIEAGHTVADGVLAGRADLEPERPQRVGLRRPQIAAAVLVVHRQGIGGLADDLRWAAFELQHAPPRQLGVVELARTPRDEREGAQCLGLDHRRPVMPALGGAIARARKAAGVGKTLARFLHAGRRSSRCVRDPSASRGGARRGRPFLQQLAGRAVTSASDRRSSRLCSSTPSSGRASPLRTKWK